MDFGNTPYSNQLGGRSFYKYEIFLQIYTIWRTASYIRFYIDLCYFDSSDFTLPLLVQDHTPATFIPDAV